MLDFQVVFWWLKGEKKLHADSFLILISYWNLALKFIYSEKATKFCEIFTLLLSYVVPVKSKGKIFQNFVAFSGYMNFNTALLSQRTWLWRPDKNYLFTPHLYTAESVQTPAHFFIHELSWSRLLHICIHEEYSFRLLQLFISFGRLKIQ